MSKLNLSPKQQEIVSFGSGAIPERVNENETLP